MILRARIVATLDQPPVEDGVVLVRDGLVLAAGRWSDWRAHVTGEVMDLGAVTVLPGLINTHCHLDYTAMAGLLFPSRSFSEWITGILALKAEWGYTEYATSWIRGAAMLLRHGTTTVADLEAVPELLPEVWDATPMRVLSFLELTGVRHHRDPASLVAEAMRRVEGLPKRRQRAHLAPHAPYSTPAGLLKLALEASRQRGWPCTMHLAESEEEFDMFAHGRGRLHDWLQRNGRDMRDCGAGSPVTQLHRAGCLGPEFLAVHVNYLADGDARLLGASGVSVAHCPRSHRYFQHARFPYERLDEAGVNLTLATDSLATVRCSLGGQGIELDLFEEMRAFRAAYPGVPPERILPMVTSNAARALGFGDALGRLGTGLMADLIVLRCGAAARGVEEEILEHRGEVAGVMIGGEWVMAPTR